MKLVEDLGAEVNKYSLRNEYMNIVCNLDTDYSFTFYHCLS